METQDHGKTGMNGTDAANGPDGESLNIRASSYFLLQAAHRCAGCGKVSRVYALAVPPGHESTESDLELDEDDGDSLGLDPQAFHEWLFSPAQWQEIPGPAMISGIRALSPPVAQAMQSLAPRFRPNPDRDGEWSNYCEHCGEPVWDGALYPSPGQAFCPKDAGAAAQVTVLGVDAPFGAFYGMCWTDSYRNKWPLFAHMGFQCSEED